MTEPTQQLGGVLFSIVEARTALKTFKTDYIARNVNIYRNLR